jgi:hypothetical protein
MASIRSSDQSLVNHYRNSRCLQPNQQVAFLSDGGEDVRGVQLYLHPEAEHLLDWFHVSMRLTAETDCQETA